MGYRDSGGNKVNDERPESFDSERLAGQIGRLRGHIRALSREHAQRSLLQDPGIGVGSPIILYTPNPNAAQSRAAFSCERI
jgi:hypothetical protein